MQKGIVILYGFFLFFMTTAAYVIGKEKLVEYGSPLDIALDCFIVMIALIFSYGVLSNKPEGNMPQLEED